MITNYIKRRRRRKRREDTEKERERERERERVVCVCVIISSKIYVFFNICSSFSSDFIRNCLVASQKENDFRRASSSFIFLFVFFLFLFFFFSETRTGLVGDVLVVVRG